LAILHQFLEVGGDSSGQQGPYFVTVVTKRPSRPMLLSFMSPNGTISAEMVPQVDADNAIFERLADASDAAVIAARPNRVSLAILMASASVLKR
jgi:hypothetical protein